MGTLCVLSRALQNTPTGIILFYNCIFGMIFMSLYVGVEILITGEPSRMREYTSRHYMIALAAGFLDFNMAGFLTLAYQSTSSGFVSLLSYMNIVYAYLCDLLILNLTLNLVEMVAALVILITAISVAFYKLKISQLKQESAH